MGEYFIYIAVKPDVQPQKELDTRWKGVVQNVKKTCVGCNHKVSHMSLFNHLYYYCKINLVVYFWINKV